MVAELQRSTLPSPIPKMTARKYAFEHRLSTRNLTRAVDFLRNLMFFLIAGCWLFDTISRYSNSAAFKPQPKELTIVNYQLTIKDLRGRDSFSRVIL